jgi:TIR domain
VKVFISWSGSTSHDIAMILREWLPSVLQVVEPYVSSEDIEKGARWSSDLSMELADSNYGIICVTRENLNAPWLNFEAGALSKTFEKARVSPLLFQLDRSDVTGPLLQFQSTLIEKTDVFRLVHSVNAACADRAMEHSRLDRILDVWWPTLEDLLGGVQCVLSGTPASEVLPAESRSNEEVLRELLELVRGQQRLLNAPEELLPSAYIAAALRSSGLVPETDVPFSAYRDLEGSWFQLEDHLRSAGHVDQDPELAALIHMVVRPVRYITHRVLLRDRYGRTSHRSQEPSFEMPEPEPDPDPPAPQQA